MVPGAKKHRNYRGFGLARRQKTRFFFFNGVFCSETVQKTRKHQLFDHFSALQMKVKKHAATSLCEDVSM